MLEYRTGIRGGIDPKDSPDTFAFGKDGKPLFIAGPHDGEAKCNLIIKTLSKKLGPDGFHYILPMLGFGDILDEGDFDGEEDEEAGAKEKPQCQPDV